MSTQYQRLYSLMQRPQGCQVHEACAELGITPSGCRGMVRDLKEVVPVRTEYLGHGGRGRGQRAVHFARQPSAPLSGKE